MVDFTEKVADVTAKILSKGKYKYIHPGLIDFIVRSELKKSRGQKETIKAITSKLHQIGGAYFPSRPDYNAWRSALELLPAGLNSPEAKDFCRQVLAKHYSTRERLPILETFFNKTLAPIAPIRSILDLACGFNPLAVPWMPLGEDFKYKGCDIFEDMVGFLSAFSSHFAMNADFSTCNLLDCTFNGNYQVAYLLKTISCLEQVNANFSSCLLEAIPADFLLISFPVRSLSGLGKGMREFYSNHLQQLLSGKNWPVLEFKFSDELAYLVEKR